MNQFKVGQKVKALDPLIQWLIRGEVGTIKEVAPQYSPNGMEFRSWEKGVIIEGKYGNTAWSHIETIELIEEEN